MERLEQQLFNLELKLNILNKELKENNTLLKDLNPKYFKTMDWIPEREAQTILGLKETSLWSMRKRKLIRFTKVGSRIFYSLKSIEDLMQKGVIK